MLQKDVFAKLYNEDPKFKKKMINKYYKEPNTNQNYYNKLLK